MNCTIPYTIRFLRNYLRLSQSMKKITFYFPMKVQCGADKRSKNTDGLAFNVLYNFVIRFPLAAISEEIFGKLINGVFSPLSITLFFFIISDYAMNSTFF